jgi:hypothetical protein
LSKQKRAKRKKRIKREKRRKNRVNLVIRHFSECDARALEPAGNWFFDQDGMHVQMRCKSCQLRVVRHNEAGEYSIKDVGRVKWDATVLDLLTLSDRGS